MLKAILPDVMNGDDIGMRQVSGGMGFALKTAQEAFVSRQALVQHLDGHHATKGHILGLVDDGHTTAANALEETITAV